MQQQLFPPVGKKILDGNLTNGLTIISKTNLPDQNGARSDQYTKFKTHSLLASAIKEAEIQKNSQLIQFQKHRAQQIEKGLLLIDQRQQQFIATEVKTPSQKPHLGIIHRPAPSHSVNYSRQQNLPQQNDLLLTGHRIGTGNQLTDQQNTMKPQLLPIFKTETPATSSAQCLSPPISLKIVQQMVSTPQSALEGNSTSQSYIYDFLFVQLTQAVYERDYSHKIKIQQKESASPSSQKVSTFESMANETQFNSLKVLRETNDDKFIETAQNTISQLNQQNKKFKFTMKRSYINEILIQKNGVSKIVVILISNHSLLVQLNSTKKPPKIEKKTIDEETVSCRTPDVNGGRSSVGRKKQKLKLNIVAQQRGYESENEKSIDSTTTSSTLLIQINNKNRKSNEVQTETTPKQSKIKLIRSKNDDSQFRKSAQTQDDIATYKALKQLQDPNTITEQKYPETKIKLWHQWEPSFQIAQHPLQVMFDSYNEFIKIVFGQKSVYEIQFKQRISQLLKLAKNLGVSLHKGQLQPSHLKSRENCNLLKEKIFQQWCRIISQSNTYDSFSPSIFNKKLDEKTKFHVENDQILQTALISAQSEKPQMGQHYKAHVGRGNNGQLVKSLFKSRFWWLLHDKEEMEKVNFMWTQCRKQDIIRTFRTKLLFSKDLQGSKRKRNSSAINFILGGNGPIQERSVSISKDMNNKEEVVAKNTEIQKQEQFPIKIYNKLEDNYHLSNKKALFLNMRFYYEALGQDPFYALPMTFHVKSGLEDPEFFRFKSQFESAKGDRNNIWIIKPGENTNRGQGISVSKDYHEITSIIEESTSSKKRTCIVQKYISNPLLINKRKFDIRSYALVTSINGNMKGFFYDEGYLRTSSREFSISNLSNKLVHLTNDAIQKHAPDYGKFEAGNKLSYVDFQNYLDKFYSHLNICFERDLLPQLKKLTSDCFKAVWGKMDPLKRINTFEIFGLDFMFDDEFKPYLIEVNTNPCLELSSPLLARLIPNMMENAFRIVADPIYPPPEGFSQKKQVVQELCPECKFSLVFDEKIDGPIIETVFKTKDNVIVEIDEDELSDEEVIDD